MIPRRSLTFAVAGLAWLCGGVARAESPCEAQVTRANVVACALGASPDVRGAQHVVAATDARKTAASVLLPANPTLSGTAGYSTSPVEGNGVAWTATLSQEIAIGGQRGKRRDVAEAERAVAKGQLGAAERDVAADALFAYFDVLAANEGKRTADRLIALGNALTQIAAGRLEQGLGSELDAELAAAAATKLAQAQVAAQQQLTTARATLSSALGLDPLASSPNVEGALEPLAVPESDVNALVQTALARRPELAVAEAERQTEQRRGDLYRRSRIPNLTVSVFAQNDAALNDRVFGLGLALPVPIARTYAGEIAEAEALTAKATTDADRIRRAVRLEVVTAFENLAARRREVALFSPERLARSQSALDAIARELDAKRLMPRDALVAEQGLVELLHANVEARRQLCRASVELVRVAGLPLEAKP